jgi:PAS domain S-box-containing protein
MDFITELFNHNFASRWGGDCNGWTRELAVAHIIADMLIWLSYMAIPLLLIRIMRSRRDIPFNTFFLLFAVFIVGCGFTHFMGAITAVFPYYYFDFWIKAGTAIASIGTAWVLWRAFPQIITFPNPTTSLETAEKANKKLQDLADVIERSVDAIMIIDKDDKIEFWNESAERMFHWNRSEIIGEKLTKVISPEHYDFYKQAVEDIKGGKYSVSTEITNIDKDGKEFPVQIDIFSISGNRLAKIVRDRSNYVHIKRLEEANLELAVANKELEDFALVAAHDLQDPIKQNQVFLRLIQEGKNELIPEVIKNSKRLNDFVTKLLEFARVGTNIKIADNSVQDILNTVLKDLDLRIKQSGAVINVNCRLPKIKCDGTQIGRVFQNLIVNTLKAKHPDRQLIITLGCSSSNDHHEFTVKDNGIGIPAEMMKNLFVPYRGKKKDTTGVGFGLAVCKRIIDRHQGTIKAKSEVGVGTEFTFTIPKKENV